MSLPSILLRPLAFGRIIKAFWDERWRSIEVNKSHRYKLYSACFLNVVYEFIDFFCVPLFIIVCLLLIRFYHIIKSWKAMLAQDKRKYGKQERHDSETGQDPNKDQSPEIQLQPQQNQQLPPLQRQATIEVVTIDEILRFDFKFRGVIIAEFFWSIIGLYILHVLLLFFMILHDTYFCYVYGEMFIQIGLPFC